MHLVVNWKQNDEELRLGSWSLLSDSQFCIEFTPQINEYLKKIGYESKNEPSKKKPFSKMIINCYS